MHRSEDILLCGLGHGVLLVIGQDDHILSLVVEKAVQVCRQILDIVDTSSQLSPLAKVVDPNE